MQYYVNDILRVMKANGYTVFENDSKPYNLNLIAIRNEGSANLFDDVLYAMYKYKNEWVVYEYAVTTDPGTVYRHHPININGTAIIKPGQYKNLWGIGLHKGRYKALVQKGIITVYRDNDLDNELDFGPITDSGNHGINCHKAGSITEFVDNYSAGCVVHATSYLFDNEFIPLCEEAATIYGNSFTFTLLNKSMF